jgi:hypothetical protein
MKEATQTVQAAIGEYTVKYVKPRGIFGCMGIIIEGKKEY